MPRSPEPRPRDVAAAISPYRELLESLISGAISADQFETEYLRKYLDNNLLYTTAVFNLVDAFFADVDAYVSDPELRDPAAGDLGPEELRERARELLRRAGYQD